MCNGKITYFILIFQAIFIENKEVSKRNTLFSKLVNCTESLNDQIFYDKNYPVQMELVNSRIEHKCSYKCITTNESYARSGHSQARFINSGTDDLKNQDQMETPAAKFSVFNLLTGDDKDGDDKSDDNDDDNDDEDDEEEDNDNDLDTESNEFDSIENTKDEDIEEEEDYDINFFGDVEDSTVPNKLKDKNDGFLKQYNRHSLRMHNLVFPLLLAYKLKFFTVIPLFLGSLVLLVGTTGMAGFFFALFSAALGLHPKSYNH